MMCDKCTFFQWYYDYCVKWKCKVDFREVRDCFKARVTDVKEKNK